MIYDTYIETFCGTFLFLLHEARGEPLRGPSAAISYSAPKPRPSTAIGRQLAQVAPLTVIICLWAFFTAKSSPALLRGDECPR